MLLMVQTSALLWTLPAPSHIQMQAEFPEVETYKDQSRTPLGLLREATSFRRFCMSA